MNDTIIIIADMVISIYALLMSGILITVVWMEGKSTFINETNIYEKSFIIMSAFVLILAVISILAQGGLI